MEKIRRIVSFIYILNQFCLVNRDNLLSDGTRESDSDHTFKLCFLAMLLLPYLKTPVDALKIHQMALIHDIAEAQTKDFSYAVTASDKQVRAQKKKAEQKAISEYAGRLPSPVGQQIFDLWQEYEARQTREAQIVYALDRMEATLQSNFYKGGVAYWGQCPNGQFYYENAVKTHPYVQDLKEEILNDLEQAVVQISKQNIQKMNAAKTRA